MKDLIRAGSYHAHVYFQDAQAPQAEALRERAAAALGAIATVWPLRRTCVGPHLAPMFEIEFPDAARDAVVAWVQANRGGLPVMLHPETGDDLTDHRDHAVWLGEDLGLDFSRL